MRFNTLLLAGSALLLTALSPATAATIAGLHNTGVDSANAVISGVGSVDQHWTLTGGTAYVSGENGVFPLAKHWMPDDQTSRWITPAERAGTSFDPVRNGQYAYGLNFSLAGFDPSTAGFTGRFATDNNVAQITLNGNLLAASGGGFRSWTDFATSSGFVDGLNRIEFVVTNARRASGTPTGLRVEFTGSDVKSLISMPPTGGVPEPASWALMIGGFGMVGAAMRRRELALAA